jgi:hypothetical protein
MRSSKGHCYLSAMVVLVQQTGLSGCNHAKFREEQKGEAK